MEIGVFIPIGSNGWLISTTAPRYRPSFDLNRHVTGAAERYGMDFALSMIKLRGFGGECEFWDHALDSFTLMAGLAAVTSRIRLFATVPTLAVPPALAARMTATIDSISGGRFGLNVITGWQRPEYSQMGIWPGDAYFAQRYEYASEYVTILRELWTQGVSDLKGKFFQMEDCRLSPRPQVPIKIICAGQSDAGLAFTARHADYNFTFGKGLNSPGECAPVLAKMRDAGAQAGRDVGCYALFMVIAAATDAEAHDKWAHYRNGADPVALAWLSEQGKADTRAAVGEKHAAYMMNPASAVNLNMGTLVGSPATIAGLLDEASTLPGLAGVMLVFDDFVEGMAVFGEQIQPLMRSRR